MVCCGVWGGWERRRSRWCRKKVEGREEITPPAAGRMGEGALRVMVGRDGRGLEDAGSTPHVKRIRAMSSR